MICGVWSGVMVACGHTFLYLTLKFADRGKEVEIIGLEGPSKQLLDALSGKL